MDEGEHHESQSQQSLYLSARPTGQVPAACRRNSGQSQARTSGEGCQPPRRTES